MQFPKIWLLIFLSTGIVHFARYTTFQKLLLEGFIFCREVIHRFANEDVSLIVFLCRKILHRFANEDVSLGSWFIGLDVEHVDDRSLCCGSTPG